LEIYSAVLDSVHGGGLPQQLQQMGVEQENLVKWSLNGIEHFYPPRVLDSIFGMGGNIEIKGDVISRNQLSYSKNVLSEKVCALLTPSTVHHQEFEGQLLNALALRVV
jgi:hypothetical protein